MLLEEISAVTLVAGVAGCALSSGKGLVEYVRWTQPSLRDDPWGKGLPDELTRWITTSACGLSRPTCSP